MKTKLKKKSSELLLAILGCDQKMLGLVIHLFERFEAEFGKEILHKVVEDLKETDGRCHFENLILGVLLEVLDEINKKYSLEFDCSCLEQKKSSYEFALPYLEEALFDMKFSTTQVACIISEFNAWKVVMNQSSVF